MTGHDRKPHQGERKPQSPEPGPQPRQRTTWGDGDYSRSGMFGDAKPYERLPNKSEPKQFDPAPAPNSISSPE